MIHDNDEHEKHESYGLISFSRRGGNPGRLFGSPLKSHESFITLSIKRGERIIDNTGTEHFYGSIRGDVVEVDMSAAQFTELLTTMNIGLGVTCTIRNIENRQMEKPPSTEMEVEKIRSNFKSNMKEVSKLLTRIKKE